MTAMPREFKTKLMLNIGITLAILAVIVGVTFYLQSDLSMRSAEILQINQDVANKASALNDFNILQQEQPDAAPLLAKMNAAMPAQDMLFSVQQNFEALAQTNSLAFSSEFGAETNATADSPGLVSIEMTLQGNYNNILAFLKSIEGSTGFISISSIDMTGQPGGAFNAIITGSIPFHG